ncbi:uncharacterized protein LOC130110415 isoform X2 [Lampris incognitus]|uniref:uncharacterized protein LOC130110415 isoform X2 n=1 Tax=Lampris incognitus TaxID=2546036 RepID=UPI0024B4A64F|nr:uncharacterized protein LOC130110415 isoform X2 [Lampris incognitus]
MVNLKCAYRSCQSTTKLFSFPTDSSRSRRWLQIVGYPEDTKTSNLRVCANHFSPECFRNYTEVQMGYSVRLRLTDDAVPSPPEGPPSKMFREMGCQTKVMTFDAECQTEPSENDLQWQTSSADSMQSHKKPSRRRKGSPSTLYDDCDWKSPVKMENQSDCQAEFGQHKRSKHVVNTQLKDHLRISHDKMMETTGGYGTTVCSEFDKECESLHGQLQVKVETEEVHIQDVHHAFMEIKPVKVKEEPDDCPSSSTSNIYGVIEQALPSPGHLKQEEEEPEAVTQYEDIVKVVVKQEDEKLILVKEEDKISEF